MHYRNLGRTGAEVSRQCLLGTAAITLPADAIDKVVRPGTDLPGTSPLSGNPSRRADQRRRG